jgi:hypothetical protein
MIPEMGFIFKLFFVTAFAASPVYMLDVFVMPALTELSKTYSTAGETAHQVANSEASRH